MGFAARASKAFVVTCGALAPLVGCSVFTSFTNYVGDADASISGTGATDGGGAVMLGSDGGSSGGPGVVTLANANGITRATGLPTHAHLVWLDGASEWLLFYETNDAPSSLRTRVSKDFATWTDGPDLALPFPHGGEGRNFAVARAEVAGGDVVHIAITIRIADDDHRHFHARAAIDHGGAITFGSVDEVTRSVQMGMADDPDGPAIAITDDLHVVHFTGAATNNPDGGGTDNEYAFRSQAADDGTFTTDWDRTTLEVVPDSCNARGAATLDGADVLALWENGKNEPEPTNVRSQKMSGSSSQGQPTDVFRFSTSFDANDWGFTRVSSSEVHIARLRDDGKIERAVWDGNQNRWNPKGNVPDESLAHGAGVVVVSVAAGISLLGIADADGAIRSTVSSGDDFGAWSTVVPANGKPRIAISSAIGRDATAIVWTEGSGASTAIAGVLVR